MKQHLWSRNPGVSASLLVCTTVIAVTAIAGVSSGHEAVIGAIAAAAAIGIGVVASRVRYDAKVNEIERLATRDPVTGLANRRVLDEALPREVARARRTDAALSVIVLDIDRFKRVNDVHGHLAGDGVLRSVGAALVANTKGYDVAVRLGGDEFAVLLPGCSAADAANVAERLLLRTVAEIDGHPVTVSAGYASLTSSMLDGRALLAAGDAGLYAAKRGGRSRAATVQFAFGAAPELVPRE